MVQFALKVVITALVVAGVSELGKRSSVAGAVLASLPLTSILALIWLHRDTGSAEKVIGLSMGIFWAVLPSLVFFLVLPLFMRAGFRFPWALSAASAVMVAAYALYVVAMRKLGVAV